MMTATEPTGRRSACKVRLATWSISAGKPRKSTFQPGMRAGRYPFRPRPTESTIRVTVLGHAASSAVPACVTAPGRPGAGVGVRVAPGAWVCCRVGVAELLATWFVPLADPRVLQPAATAAATRAPAIAAARTGRPEGPRRPDGEPRSVARRGPYLPAWSRTREHAVEAGHREGHDLPGFAPRHSERRAATRRAQHRNCPTGRTGLARPQCGPVEGHVDTVPSRAASGSARGGPHGGGRHAGRSVRGRPVGPANLGCCRHPGILRHGSRSTATRSPGRHAKPFQAMLARAGVQVGLHAFPASALCDWLPTTRRACVGPENR